MKIISTKSMTRMSREILGDLIDDGYNKDQILTAMEDGEYLKEAGISQEIAEEIHDFLRED